MASEPANTVEPEIETSSAAQKRTRAEAIQRLQVGLSGLAAMLLLVSLANILLNRAKEAERDAVPDAVSSVASAPATSANKDPLVDAGVVPELPSEPVAGPGAVSAGANAPPSQQK